MALSLLRVVSGDSAHTLEEVVELVRFLHKGRQLGHLREHLGAPAHYALDTHSLLIGRSHLVDEGDASLGLNNRRWFIVHEKAIHVISSI